MKRLSVLALFCGAMMATLFVARPAQATTDFNKEWKKHYLQDDTDEAFVKTAKKTGCYVCHVKGHPDKKKARNEYGKAVHKFLDKDEIKALKKDDPEKAAATILEGLKKAGAEKSASGQTFDEKIKANELPAVAEE